MTGDNGILTKAQTAKEETQKASEEEQLKLAAMNAAMNTERYDYKVEDGTVPIPAGFAPTGIEGENTIAEGVVVVDENGNEFVWIPVTDENQYVRNTTYEFTDVSETATDDKDYLPDGIADEKQTVVTARGFYISRFEVGAEGGKLDENLEEYTGEWTEEPTLVSKKEAKVYNWIAQEECKAESKKFINNNEVKSGLITGIQWDVVMKFVDGKQDGNNPSKTFDVKTIDDTRHTRSLATSGQNIADKVYNIYDLEGNYYEYVAEKSDYDTNMPYVYRGGYCDSRYYGPASSRNRNNGVASKDFSFRLVLYVM